MPLALLALTSQAQERGFQVQRFEGTSPGGTTFFVDRPWYSSTRFFAAGLTTDYSYRALVPTVETGRGELVPVFEHVLQTQIQLAASFFDRVHLRGSLPLTLFELGAAEIVSQVAPVSSVAVGDARLGLWVRVAGQSEKDGISLHLGADIWLPLGAPQLHQGDGAVRAQVKAVSAGALGSSGRWALEGAFLLRRYASLGPPELGWTAASELRLGAAVGLSFFSDRLTLGPEILFSSQVFGENAFQTKGMALELIGGAQWLIANHIQLGVAGGTAWLGVAGRPDARAILRLAWAPRRSHETAAATQEAPTPPDADGDGVDDGADRCPFEAETQDGIRDSDGCPEFRLPALTKVLLAPSRAVDAGVATDAGAAVNAWVSTDSDSDGVVDSEDRCPVTAEDRDDFEDDDGCPEADNDGDSLADAKDRCGDEAEVFNGVDDDDGCADLAPDADNDGVADGPDRCPYEPESADGIRDDDGCPEASAPALAALFAPAGVAATDKRPGAPVDTDKDGLSDEEDRCPLTKEDADGFEDDDGCPERDNDDDGIADAQDRCVDAAESFNGSVDNDGCPDDVSDADDDGFGYDDDRCPLEPGAAPDGCPHLPQPALSLPGFAARGGAKKAVAAQADYDGDTIADEVDPCPVSKEDADGFEDDDGCPERDNDRDGVVDTQDRCPLEAETINGAVDADGCPDKGDSLVVIEREQVIIKGVIRFKLGSATLERSALPLLQQVASKLKAASTISLEIAGHTDDTGNAVTNIRLSKKRAEAIRSVLVKAGVAAQRLVAQGYGPTRPKASNSSAAGREQNRRVEFNIVGEAK
jgi:outer membrane protein OmpA-like peptidoglycan-associated protein